MRSALTQSLDASPLRPRTTTDSLRASSVLHEWSQCARNRRVVCSAEGHRTYLADTGSAGSLIIVRDAAGLLCAFRSQYGRAPP